MPLLGKQERAHSSELNGPLMYLYHTHIYPFGTRGSPCYMQMYSRLNHIQLKSELPHGRKWWRGIKLGGLADE